MEYCHECGSEMLPDEFPTNPDFPEFKGHPKGAVIDGQLWLRCCGCAARGGWYAADLGAFVPLLKG